MYVEFLQTRKNLSREKVNKYLETIAGESNRLSKLINNVLDISRMERGTLKPQYEQVNVNTFLQEILNSMKYELDLHHFEVHFDQLNDDIFASIDKSLMERAVVNLISNAIKYSGQEKYLFLRIVSNKDETGIEVEDKGPGIALSEQEKIYDIFYRSTDKGIQAVGGAGLGLAIVDHTAKVHRGRIELKSERGKGSTFTLWFPKIRT
jgi:two-component system phosphate regulon sensor histidine kinase PhoR